jgi:hypothetical protein
LSRGKNVRRRRKEGRTIKRKREIKAIKQKKDKYK